MKSKFRILMTVLLASAGTFAAADVADRIKYPKTDGFDAGAAAYAFSILAFGSSLTLGINHFLHRRWA